MIITKLQSGLHAFANLQKFTNRPISAVLMNGRLAVATDSYRLVEITNAEIEKADTPILITAQSLKARAKIKNAAHVTKEGKRLVGVENGSFILDEYPDEKADAYPKYNQIFPTATPKFTITCNGRLLGEVLTYLSKLPKDEKVTLDFHSHNQPIGNGHIARAMVMPILS